MATIEEQQKALWQLKMNMLDNMTENGILRNADCKKVIDTHQKVSDFTEKLTVTLSYIKEISMEENTTKPWKIHQTLVEY